MIVLWRWKSSGGGDDVEALKLNHITASKMMLLMRWTSVELDVVDVVEAVEEDKQLDDGVALTVGPKEGPVAGGDGLVVLADRHGHGAGEDVEGEPLHPLVPVALVELGTVCNTRTALLLM